MIVGFIDVIFGHGRAEQANIFVNDQRYIFTDLSTMGWVLIVLGIVQIAGGLSLFVGNTFGRVIGIAGAGFGAIGALLSIGGNNPWWSLRRLLPLRLHHPRHLPVRRRGRADLS